MHYWVVFAFGVHAGKDTWQWSCTICNAAAIPSATSKAEEDLLVAEGCVSNENDILDLSLRTKHLTSVANTFTTFSSVSDHG